jgi:glycosyltransferase involved in cell wall biosynthesis
MKISIIIAVSNDLRIEKAIKSIDEDVEIIISLNKPTKDIVDLVSKLKRKNQKIKICTISYLSIAGAYNNGIKHSTYSNILLMDSDCVFEKGCIKRLYRGLKKSPLSKGLVVFRYKSKVEKIISQARDFHCSGRINAYSPPLLFKKNILSKIGGYYFHPALCWMEDGEFDCRVQKAKLPIYFDPKAKIYHDRLNLKTDLKNAFMYGVGWNISSQLKIDNKPSGLIKSISQLLIKGTKEKGFITGVYLYIWKIVILLGYNIQRLFKIRDPYQK